jgi:hypothetical protein
VWVVDYDTLVLLDRSTLVRLGSVRLQQAPERTAMFVGEPWLDSSEEVLVVARPFSGDAVIVDPSDLSVTSIVELGQQPLEAAIVGDCVVGRDWKTGSLLIASPPRRRRRWRR